MPATNNTVNPTDPFSNPKFQEMARQFEPGASEDPFAGFANKPKGNALTNAWHKATTSMGDALRIEPKVIPAPDPTTLSSRTPELGFEVYYQAAKLAEQQGRNDQAISQYQRALEKAPDNLPTMLSFARLYDRQGEFERAVEIYQNAIKAHPDSAVAHNDLGLCLARQGNYPASVLSLREAVRLEPSKALYRNNYGTVLVAAGQTQEALAQFQQVHPPAAAHYNLAYLLQQAGKTSEAVDHLRQAVAIDPALDPATELLAQLAPPAMGRDGGQLTGRSGGMRPGNVRPASATGTAIERTPPVVVPQHPPLGMHPVRESMSDEDELEGEIAATVATPSAAVRSGIKLRYPTMRAYAVEEEPTEQGLLPPVPDKN
jgi:tetratricopeptide (TPR) repeat protein